MRKLLEKIKILKDKSEEKEIVYVPSPAEIIYEKTPAETKIVYQTVPAETKIVYEKSPAETVYVDREVIIEAPAEECTKPEIPDNLKFMGVKVKENDIVRGIYNFMGTDTYKRASFIFIIVVLFIFMIRRRRS